MTTEPGLLYEDLDHVLARQMGPWKPRADRATVVEALLDVIRPYLDSAHAAGVSKGHTQAVAAAQAALDSYVPCYACGHRFPSAVLETHYRAVHSDG